MESARAVLYRLRHKTAMRLRSMKYLAGGMRMDVHWVGDGKSRSEAEFLETEDTVDFNRILRGLWQRLEPNGKKKKPLKIGVTLLRLSQIGGETASLLDSSVVERRKLNAAMDEINFRYGKNTVYFGGTHEAKMSAPMRIAFNHVPDLKTEGD